VKFKKIGIIADKNSVAKKALAKLKRKYKLIAIKDEDNVAKAVDLIIALGGDGLMLHSLHRFMNAGKPIYGMNCGTIGFLMNEYNDKDLLKNLAKAKITKIHPLLMKAVTADGKTHEAVAVNEVSLLRKSGQAAKVKISIDGVTHLGEMVCDGVLVATPAGSSAYNFSIGGPILPLKSKLLALTPISPFRPRRWRGALLPHKVTVRFDIVHHKKRPVNVTADFHDVSDVTSVEVKEDSSKTFELLFDPGHGLEERILREQFAY